MKARIQKWGEGLAVCIPDELAANFRVDDEVELSFIEGKLLIASLNPTATEYRLEDLLAQVTNDNLHGEYW